MGGQICTLSPKNSHQKTVCLPFVKWAGGKRGIVNELQKRMPASFRCYYEPFVGGGAFFFALQPNKAILVDKNAQLINTYQVVRGHVHSLMQLLDEHIHLHSRDHYYEVRALPYDSLSPEEQAARFIYLNKTCYNGLYRVNKTGEFNVPYGHRSTVRLYNKENLLRCSRALQHAQIQAGDFYTITPQVGDFVYLDPPYDDTFSQYTSEDFSADDQRRLCQFCTELNARGVRFVLSNSDTPFIRELYKNFRIEEITAPRYISCNGQTRGKIQEVIVSNG